MDFSSLLAGLGGAEGGVDPTKLVGGVQEVFASQGLAPVDRRIAASIRRVAATVITAASGQLTPALA